MPRYVLLRHDCPADYRDGPHWDLMLEHQGKLRTWSLLALPTSWGGDAAGEVSAARLPDHRIAYLDYEGEVSGNRGTVRRVAAGEYVSAERDNGLDVQATGDLAGAWQLTSAEGNRWRLLVS